MGKKKRATVWPSPAFFSSLFFSLDIPEHSILRCLVSEKEGARSYATPRDGVGDVRTVCDGLGIIICCVTLKLALTVTGLKSGQLGETDVTSLL